MTLPKETTMIERLARALALEEYPDQPSEWHDDHWKGWIDTARAVLTALREPTPEMVEAGRNAPIPLVYIDSISGRQRMELRARFIAAIDRTLSDGEG